MSRSTEKWFLVQWKEGGVDVVHVRSLIDVRVEDLEPGASMSVYLKGEPKTGTFICKSNDRQLLDEMQHKMKGETENGPKAEGEPEQEPGDFSASASSWEPSDGNASESDEAEEKKTKVEHFKKQYTNERSRRRILTPSNTVNAIIPVKMQRRKYPPKKIETRKRTYGSNKKNGSMPVNERELNAREVTLKNIKIDINDILVMRKTFRELFQIVKNMKTRNRRKRDKKQAAKAKTDVSNPKIDMSKTLTNAPGVSDEDKENEECRSPESDRSGDNILISNKYKKYNGNNSNNKSPQQAKKPEGEWIPIGSGKTVLHKDKFRKVNWKSYTIATRTLLLALFPRRILATHSLTGKRSPAFQNKPAKMCLDPKIISDVIIEIQDRFSVKENLIRSIITTKCADECKMYKMRQDRRKSIAAVGKHGNIKKDDEDQNNRTA